MALHALFIASQGVTDMDIILVIQMETESVYQDGVDPIVIFVSNVLILFKIN